MRIFFRVVFDSPKSMDPGGIPKAADARNRGRKILRDNAIHKLLCGLPTSEGVELRSPNWFVWLIGRGIADEGVGGIGGSCRKPRSVRPSDNKNSHEKISGCTWGHALQSQLEGGGPWKGRSGGGDGLWLRVEGARAPGGDWRGTVASWTIDRGDGA
jgi:hypothetical protein